MNNRKPLAMQIFFSAIGRFCVVYICICISVIINPFQISKVPNEIIYANSGYVYILATVFLGGILGTLISAKSRKYNVIIGVIGFILAIYAIIP